MSSSAHCLNIAHCDVRPSNVIKFENCYVLVDWGMSTEIGSRFPHLHRVPAFVHDDILLKKDLILTKSLPSMITIALHTLS